MDRKELPEGMIQEWQAVFADEIRDAAGELMSGDLDHLEHRLQAVSRVVFGRVMTETLGCREQGVERRWDCPRCGGAVWLVRRGTKHGRGLVGDVALTRETLVCRSCQRGCVPFDEELGRGTPGLTPGLGRVVARVGIMDAFREAADVLNETLGITLPPETVRTEGRL